MQQDFFQTNNFDDYRKMKHFQNENEEQNFLDEIAKQAMTMTEDGIQFLFDLSDDELKSEKIQYAIKKGDMLNAKLVSDKLRQAAENGEKWAIMKLLEMNNKNKQKQEITSRQVLYKNANSEIDWETIKKDSDFN